MAKVSRSKKLLALAGCLIIVCGAYVLVSKAVAKAEDNSDSDDQIPFVTADADDIRKLTWTYEDETCTLVKKDDTWYLENDGTLDVEQSIPQSMMSVLSGLTAYRKISDVSDFSQYGLDDDAVDVSRISFETSDGTVTEILTGDYNEVSSWYYSMVAGSSDVYMTDGSYLEYFNYGAADLEVAEDDDSSEAEEDTADAE